MKGFIFDIGWTLAVLIAAIIAILALLITFLVFHFRGIDPLSYSLEFIDVSNKPYLVSGAITKLTMGDRQFMEHAIETSVVGSLARSESYTVSSDLNAFLSRWGFYSVDIRGDSIFYKSPSLSLGTPESCGTEDPEEGFCVLKLYEDQGMEPCGVGYVEVEKDDGDCGEDLDSQYICCTYDKDAYLAKPFHYDIVRCGSENIGICNEACYEHMQYFDEGLADCVHTDEHEVNDGNTPYCCVPKPPAQVSEGIITSAEIPLFYKDKVGYFVFTMLDESSVLR